VPTNRELPRVPLALAILGLLLERPVHPYEMKLLMKERGHDTVIKLKGGSLYDTVERLHRLGFIEPLETSREGRRPERTVYALTEAGRDELKAWLRELISTPVAEFPRFAAGLAFLLCLDKEEAVQMLLRRGIALEAELAAGDSLLRSTADAGVPRIFLIETEYAQAVRRAELDWVRTLVRDIESGGLWPDHEALQAAAKAFGSRKQS
jgi:DNA-binding PadR family transcriptional regulator